MITEVSAVTFRQNLGEMLNKVQYRNDNLEELRRVLPRLAHRHGLNAQQIDDLIDILSVKAEIVEPLTTNEARLRDPNDQAILGSYAAACQTGNVSYLISGDKDLLALNPPTPVVAPAQFWDRHKGFG